MNKTILILMFVVFFFIGMGIGYVSQNSLSILGFYYGDIGDTDSMHPTFDNDTKVLCAPLDYYIGDIIVYKYNETLNVIHRVVAFKDGFIITKGDNHNVVEAVYPKDVYCKVIWYE